MERTKTYFYGYVIAEASRLSGVAYADVWRHAHNERRISADMAMRYHETLGIPLEQMRPDLWAKGGKKPMDASNG